MSSSSVTTWKDVSDLQGLNTFLSSAKVSGRFVMLQDDNDAVAMSDVVQRLKEYSKQKGAKQADIATAVEKLLECEVKPVPSTGRKPKSTKVSGVDFSVSVEDLHEITGKVRNKAMKMELEAKRSISQALHEHLTAKTTGMLPAEVEALYTSLTSKTISPQEVGKNFEASLARLYPKTHGKALQNHKVRILGNIISDLQAANASESLAECIQALGVVKNPVPGASAESATTSSSSSTDVSSVVSTTTSSVTTVSESETLATQTPTPRQLVEEYESRPWGNQEITFFGQNEPIEVTGYLPPGKTAKAKHAAVEKDRQRLLDILDAHNAKFANRISEKGLTQSGSVDSLDLTAGNSLMLRADLHSDLRSLMTQLRMLQKEKLLDENFTCKKGFHLVFLGDYMDRGINDVEVFSLLLSLRMRNPDNVHLARGNHEDINKVQVSYSSVGEWLKKNEKPITECYKSLPLAICISGGAPEDGSTPKRLMLTHALFAPHVDLFPLFEGKEKRMEISDTVTDTIQVPRRWKSTKTTPPKMKQAMADVTEWIKAADEQRKSRKESQRFTTAEMFTWTRLGEDRSTDTGGKPKDIQAWMRLNRIAMVVRGHEHELFEVEVPTKQGGSKVLIKSLPAGPETGFFADRFGKETQGILVTVTGPNIKEWQQQVVTASGTGTDYALKIEPEKKAITEKMRK